MSYSINELPNYVNTAGKVTILTALSGVAVFLCFFFVNVGTNGLMTAMAQSGNATTTLTVLNIPPDWVVQAFEDPASATSTPTNSGEVMTWKATADDSNDAPYFLLICEENSAPTANGAADIGSLGTAPPDCATGVRQWAVSTSTTDETQAFAATTTTETAPFSERNSWYAWVCDDDPENPACSPVASSTPNATSTPFHVNRRPSFDLFSNTATSSPFKDPSQIVDFVSESSDPDSVGGDDTIFLVVCNADSYSTTTNDCTGAPGGAFLASTTISFTDNATSSYTLPSIIQDQSYAAYGYIVDEHGHEAIDATQGTNVPYVVANVAPSAGTIALNGDSTIILDTPAGETADDEYTLSYVVTDANSCDAVGGSGPTQDYDEVDDFAVGIFRSGVGSSTCDANDLTDPAATHNENNCYVSTYEPWALSCTASSTSCTAGGSDDTILFECTFPLWFIADPTDAGTPFASQYWVSAVSPIDDDNATGTYATSTLPVELQSFPALDVPTFEILYGSVEPGQNTGTLSASSTLENQGNTGLDQNLLGESMCESFAVGNDCPNSSTSTIPDDQQKFGTSTSANYTDPAPAATTLSSTTPKELESNVNKNTATSTLTTGTTYWGIAVPSSITDTGDYTGFNTFQAVTAESIDW